jgi:malate dehydrogenase (oxaloacetate-decarboxylating)
MSQKLTKEELLAKAKKPAEDAIKLHAFYRGKLQVMPKCHVRNLDDFSIYYSPGVAAPCRAIEADESRMEEFTNRGNTIAVVSDCTRVLGLGDIGPKAGYPVMEGKCLIFKYLGGVDAVPICLATKDPDEIVKTVKMLEPSFAGINLEDFSYPKCFGILERLQKETNIPVWHDDVQGTGTVELAGLINALKIVGKKIENCKMVFNGMGAANTGVSRLILAYGAERGNIIVVDSKGILHKGRKDIEEKKDAYGYKWEMCQTTNAEQMTGDIGDALKGADILISCSKSGPGIISPEQIKLMANDSIVFPSANPIPEIWPWEAKEAGARIVGTGRSDFPNQVNNSMGFPAIFRGVLDVKASTITDEMCIAAADSLAEYAEERGINEEDIIAKMDEPEAFIREAVAVGMKAQEQGVAAVKISAEDLRKKVQTVIESAQGQAETLVKEGYIAKAVT